MLGWGLCVEWRGGDTLTLILTLMMKRSFHVFSNPPHVVSFEKYYIFV